MNCWQLKLFRGEDRDVEMRFSTKETSNSEPVPVDMTGSGFILRLYAAGSRRLLDELRSSTGQIVLSGENHNTLTIKFSADKTADYPAAGVFDLFRVIVSSEGVPSQKVLLPVGSPVSEVACEHHHHRN